ncbi:uncharacterized protein [Aegilops tauschii subsp. strangulata]|nr:uncharacterized protein LOC109761501 isoform X1 [Aegilops tauschii subsp. strangulata]
MSSVLAHKAIVSPARGGRTRQAMEHGTSSAAALWGHEHLPLLARARSKDSVEYILQALWRTRRTGLDAADRAIVRDILQLPSDSELDPLLVCLRILTRRCVHDNIAREEIPKLFPQEVLPELQRLLTLLLQKFQPEWREDTLKDQASAANSETTKGHLSKNQDASEQPATTQLHCGTSSAKVTSESGEKEGKLQLAKDSLDKMLNDVYPIRGKVSNAVSNDSLDKMLNDVYPIRGKVSNAVSNDSLDKMLNDVYPIRGKVSNAGNTNGGHGEAARST